MNNPNYIHTITVFRCKDGAWTRSVFHNCFWKTDIIKIQDGTNASQANTYTVRIPLEAAGGGFTVSADDIIVKGDCQDNITGKSPNTATEVLLRNKPDAFKVTAFSDNTFHRMGKHYRMGG